MYLYGKNILKEIIETRYPVKHIFFSSSKTERGSLKKIVEDVA
ncbi:MAG: RNA methyltransferase, TrmH family, group 3, partial [Petrotoga mobilis]